MLLWTALRRLLTSRIIQVFLMLFWGVIHTFVISKRLQEQIYRDISILKVAAYDFIVFSKGFQCFPRVTSNRFIMVTLDKDFEKFVKISFIEFYTSIIFFLKTKELYFPIYLNSKKYNIFSFYFQDVSHCFIMSSRFHKFSSLSFHTNLFDLQIEYFSQYFISLMLISKANFLITQFTSVNYCKIVVCQISRYF